MVITFFNKKGGVGKTSLSYNVARDLGFYLISNDDSIIEDSYKGGAKVMKEVKLIEGENIVYDLGGFTDTNIIDILKNSDLIIVPTIADVNSLKRTVNTIEEIKSLNKKILVVGNIIKGQVDKDFINKYIDTEFFIRESRLFQKALLSEKSLLDMGEDSKFIRTRSKGVFEDYENFLNFIKQQGNI